MVAPIIGDSNMAFMSQEDHFPPSLPTMDSPHVVDEYMNSMGYSENVDGIFADSYMTQSLSLSDDPVDSPGQSKPTAWTDSQGSHQGNGSLDGASSQSPESSLHDSSSESSVKHERHPSSNSSRSMTFGSAASETKAQKNKTKDAMIEKSEKDMENMHMADQWFDFDSAASSPGHAVEDGLRFQSSIKGISMPYNTSPDIRTAAAPSNTPAPALVVSCLLFRARSILLRPFEAKKKKKKKKKKKTLLD